MWLVFVALTGAVAGSMLTAVIDRAPASPASFFRSRSRCRSCGHVLAFLDLVPVFSYLSLGGRCRYCRRRIPRWHLVVELATIGLFLATVLRYPEATFPEIVLLWVILACSLALAVIDLQTMMLPDVIVAPLALAGLARSVFFGSPLWSDGVSGALFGFVLLWLLMLLPRFVPRWRGAATMGFGDVKLAGALGLSLGLSGTVAMALGAFVSGGLVGSGLLLFKRASLKSHLPFGPFLAGAGMLFVLLPELPARLFVFFGFR